MPVRRLPWWRRLRRRVYHLLAVLVLGTVRRLPAAWGRALCRGAATLAWRVRPRERELARRNVAHVFPHWSPGRQRRLLREARTSLADNLHVALTLPARVRRGLPEVEGEAALARLRELLARGRGVVILTGHFSCWELLGAWLARRLGRLTVVTGTIHNPPVDRLVNGWRREAGLTTVPRGEGLAPLLAALRRGEAVALLPDQALAAPSAMVPFCGRPAPTVTGPARLALAAGAPLLPMALAKRDGVAGLYEVVALPPLEPRGDGPDDVLELTGRINAALSTLLLRNPAEWVWFHDRWRLDDANLAGH